jgi:hypothetical protein
MHISIPDYMTGPEENIFLGTWLKERPEVWQENYFFIRQ